MDIATILSTVLFLGPGFFVRFISGWIGEPTCDEESSEEGIVKAFIYSFIILLINIFIIKFKSSREMNTFTDLINSIYEINFFLKYILLMITTSLIFTLLKTKGFEFAVRLYNKILNKNIDREYTVYSDLWNVIFYNPNLDISKHIFTIEKNGIRLTQGFIKNVSSKGRQKKSMVLNLTDIVNDYFEDEEFTKKNLSEIEREYYDFDSDVLIKMYKAEAILEDINLRNTKVRDTSASNA